MQRHADDAAGASSPTWSIRWSGRACKKLVLLNGHGGNELKPLTRELHHRTEVFLCVCDWYRMAADLYPKIFEQPGEHADEVETSLGLAFFPRAAQAGAGRRRGGAADALRGDQPRLGEHHAALAPGERRTPAWATRRRRRPRRAGG